MRPYRTALLLALLGSAALVGGCGMETQLTSGRAYLSDYGAPQTDPTRAAADLRSAGAPGARRAAMDAAIRDAADVEPTLLLPARIGIARLGAHRVAGRWDPDLPPDVPAAIPPDEQGLWDGLGQRLAPGNFGMFVAINPLVTELAAAGAGLAALSPMERLRLGAARQHVDYLLVYETQLEADLDPNVLTLFDLTIVGQWILPSTDVEARSVARAALIDVRTGYPYGTAAAAAVDSGVTTSQSSETRVERAVATTRLEAVTALVSEVEAMAWRLRPQAGARPMAAAGPTPPTGDERGVDESIAWQGARAGGSR